MPLYAMSCFKLPKTTCTQLTSAMADFLWSSVEHKRKIHWIGWDKLCLPKHQGGLGYKDIVCFNQALLAKQAWRLLQDPQCLLSRVINSRYYTHSEFLNEELGKKTSFGWKSILHGRELLNLGLKQKIGNGDSISVWIGHWIFDDHWRPPLIKNRTIDLLLMVKDLIDPGTRGWNKQRSLRNSSTLQIFS